MNMFWESNLRVIEAQYPGLAAQLRGDELPAGEIRIEPAASGDPTLIIRGIHIHSPRDPVREACRLVDTLEGNGPVIILGFGLGYSAWGIAKAFAGSPDKAPAGTPAGAGTRPIIVVERWPGILKKALECRDLQNFLTTGRIIFVLGGTGEAIAGALRLAEDLLRKSGLLDKSGLSGKPVLIRNRSLMNLDEEWYAGVERRIQTWSSKDDVNTATLKRFGKRWVRNLAANREAIRDLPGISRLEGCLAPISTPVFLAAAGPSLDAIGPLLPAIAQRAVVVAVDTSLRFLLEQGVNPDFTVVVDPQFWNARHLDRAPASKTCLIAESAVYPPVLRWNHGNTGGSVAFARAFLCASLFPLGRFIEDRLDPKGVLGAGGSVATTAWDFARILGGGAPGSTIWIAGLDLSFPDLKTHFRGALFETRSLSESLRFNPAETWSVRALRDGLPFHSPSASGGTVLTDRRLSLYSSWFESRFRQYPLLKNYSLSPGGLAIPGLPTAPVEALLALPPRRAEIDELLGNAFAQIDGDFNSPENRRDRAAKYETLCRVLIQGLGDIKTLAEEAADLAAKNTRRSMDAAAQDRILKRLDNVNRAIMESDVKEVAGFLFPPLGELEAGLNTPETDPFSRHLELSSKLYRTLAETADYNLQVLNKDIKR
jgi:hypothetical protein